MNGSTWAAGQSDKINCLAFSAKRASRTPVLRGHCNANSVYIYIYIYIEDVQERTTVLVLAQQVYWRTSRTKRKTQWFTLCKASFDIWRTALVGPRIFRLGPKFWTLGMNREYVLERTVVGIASFEDIVCLALFIVKRCCIDIYTTFQYVQ